MSASIRRASPPPSFTFLIAAVLLVAASGAISSQGQQPPPLVPEALVPRALVKLVRIRLQEGVQSGLHGRGRWPYARPRSEGLVEEADRGHVPHVALDPRGPEGHLPLEPR